MQTKAIERLVRSMVAQKLDIVYVRCYLQETYQLTEAQIDEILRRLNILPPPGVKGGPAPKAGEAIKITKQGFW
jgi:hypothetical protein